MEGSADLGGRLLRRFTFRQPDSSSS